MTSHEHTALSCDKCGGNLYPLGMLGIQTGKTYWWKCGFCSLYWWATASAHGGQLKEWAVGV